MVILSDRKTHTRGAPGEVQDVSFHSSDLLACSIRNNQDTLDDDLDFKIGVCCGGLSSFVDAEKAAGDGLFGVILCAAPGQ